MAVAGCTRNSNSTANRSSERFATAERATFAEATAPAEVAIEQEWQSYPNHCCYFVAVTATVAAEAKRQSPIQ